MMKFLYGYVTDSSCADVCGSVDIRCSSSETGPGTGVDVQPRGDGDVPSREQDVAASATHDAAAWIPTRDNEGEVVGGDCQQTCLLYHKCKTVVMLKQSYVNPYCNVA